MPGIFTWPNPVLQKWNNRHCFVFFSFRWRIPSLTWEFTVLYIFTVQWPCLSSDFFPWWEIPDSNTGPQPGTLLISHHISGTGILKKTNKTSASSVRFKNTWQVSPPGRYRGGGLLPAGGSAHTQQRPPNPVRGAGRSSGRQQQPQGEHQGCPQELRRFCPTSGAGIYSLHFTYISPPPLEIIPVFSPLGG